MRRWVLGLLAASALTLGYTWTEPGSTGDEGAGLARDFQHLTGGLGMGGTAVMAWDLATFDPRLEPDCSCGVWPVPGGFAFSPEHRLGPWDPPPLLGAAVAPRASATP